MNQYSQGRTLLRSPMVDEFIVAFLAVAATSEFLKVRFELVLKPNRSELGHIHKFYQVRLFRELNQNLVIVEILLHHLSIKNIKILFLVNFWNEHGSMRKVK